MPYIHSVARDALNNNERRASHAGELNFQFTQLALKYIDTYGLRYQTFNDIIGALEGCKMELYRRRISLYEDQKMEENGDVYE